MPSNTIVSKLLKSLIEPTNRSLKGEHLWELGIIYTCPFLKCIYFFAKSPSALSITFFLGILLLVSSGCDEGTPVENLAPDTRIFIESINLDEANSLNSVVRLHWFGEDQDGYVIGYEISQNGTDWTFTTSQDSVFQFTIPPGSADITIPFSVRALDNLNQVDLTPAKLDIPIRNTPPTISLDTLKIIPDTVSVVFSTLWNVEDLDGNATLDSVFIKVNEGPWLGLSPRQNLLTIIPLAPEETGTQEAQIYPGASSEPLPILLNGLEVGGSNQIFVKAKDIAGSESEVDTSRSFFLRPQQSDLLVIDSHGTNEPDEIYFPILNRVYPGYDYLDLIAETPPFWDLTFLLFINLYDKVFWYSDDALPQDQGLQMYLEAAAGSIQQYLNQGGKIWVTAKFASPFTDPETANQSTIFDYSPMDSLSTSTGQARIPTDSMALPLDAAYPILKSGSFITGADPFYPKNQEEVLYDVQLIKAGGWVGPPTIAAQSVFTNGQPNQIFFSVELHKLNGDAQALERLFDLVLNEVFSW